MDNTPKRAKIDVGGKIYRGCITLGGPLVPGLCEEWQLIWERQIYRKLLLDLIKNKDTLNKVTWDPLCPSFWPLFLWSILDTVNKTLLPYPRVLILLSTLLLSVSHSSLVLRKFFILLSRTPGQFVIRTPSSSVDTTQDSETKLLVTFLLQ